MINKILKTLGAQLTVYEVGVNGVNKITRPEKYYYEVCFNDYKIKVYKPDLIYIK